MTPKKIVKGLRVPEWEEVEPITVAESKLLYPGAYKKLLEWAHYTGAYYERGGGRPPWNDFVDLRAGPDGQLWVSCGATMLWDYKGCKDWVYVDEYE